LGSITVALIDHGVAGALSIGGGRNIPPGEYISYQDPNTAADLNFLVNSVQGKIERLDLFGCETSRTAPPNPLTDWTDDGNAFLQFLASGTGAIVRGWDKSTVATWNPFFSGSFWVMKGATLKTYFP
jgi:hypothetical protein